MPVIKYLERNAELYANEIALVELNPDEQDKRRSNWKEAELIESSKFEPFRRQITWSVFNEKANRFANMLLDRGIKKGDKVGILMYNCIEWLPIYFGILKTGALAVPLNFRYASDEIDYCLNLADISVLFFGPEFIGRLEAISDKIIAHRLLIYVGEGYGPTFADNYVLSAMNYSSENPAIELTDEDYGAIYFSSGTTGFPKAILHKHKALMHSAQCEQNHHGQTKDDVFLCIPPLYHTGAKMHWFGSLVSGGKAVLLRGTKPEPVIKAVSDEKCTIVWMLVPWAQDILDAIDRGEIKLSDYELGQWRLTHMGAQPIPKKLVADWLKYFPHHDYDTNYGLSESIGPGCVHLGVGNVHKVGAIGIPGYGWKCKIVDEKRNPVKQGEVGELAVFGPGVMVEYYKNPKATEEVKDAEGWLYTGDMAMQDEDGFIWLVDRKKDVIISGGENIYPVQIEDFMRKMNEIKDVAVIGLADKRLGEIATAVIEIWAPLADRLGMQAEKNEFEDLSLKYTNPDAFLQIKSIVSQKSDERSAFLEKATQALYKSADKMNIKITVQSRAKHFYSIYQKMRKRNKSTDELYDLFALRILCETSAECYALIGIVHNLWKPLEGRFKDYIAMPKSNGYQSLHTTVMCEGKPLEIQIRTIEMHNMAEHGIASHWIYKKGTNKDLIEADKLDIINRLQALKKAATEEENNFSTIKDELLGDEIYVFTPKGDVKKLRAGATAIDFAYSIHSNIGEKIIAAKADGKIIPLNKPLQNTQIIEIITNPQAHPTESQLKIVKTAKAHQKIHAWLMANDPNFGQKQTVSTTGTSITAQTENGVSSSVTELSALFLPLLLPVLLLLSDELLFPPLLPPVAF